MKTLYIMVGIPGSGKTTYVHTHLVPNGVQVICPDSLRRVFGHVFYGPLEPLVHTFAALQARALMYRGLDVVVDEATCMFAHVDRWARLAEDMGYLVEVIHMDTPLELCVTRREATNFPLEVLDRKYETLRADLRRIYAEFDPAVVRGVGVDKGSAGNEVTASCK